MFDLLRDIGPPPWAAIEGQPSCKYAKVDFALSIAKPWVKGLADCMLETLPDANLIDIRWWSCLKPGDLPGLPNWHFDCFNQEDDPRSVDEEHRLYFFGAKCRTMFRPDLRPPEGWIIRYTHEAEHRVMPAEVEGPRLLVRVSRAQIKPTTRVKAPPLIRKGQFEWKTI